MGSDFYIGWDAFQERADFSKLPENLINKDGTFDQDHFFEIITKLNPQYLEHAKNLFEEEMKVITKSDKPRNESEALENLANLTSSFIERVEFYSRLKSPDKITVGGKTREQLFDEMDNNNVYIIDLARQMMRSKAFTTTNKAGQVYFVSFSVEDLFSDSKDHFIDEIYDKATKTFGLELCQSEDGPNYSLHYPNPPQRKYLSIGMKPISVSGRSLRVFSIDAFPTGVWLQSGWMPSDRGCRPEAQFIFRLANPEASEANK